MAKIKLYPLKNIFLLYACFSLWTSIPQTIDQCYYVFNRDSYMESNFRVDSIATMTSSSGKSYYRVVQLSSENRDVNSKFLVPLRKWNWFFLPSVSEPAINSVVTLYVNERSPILNLVGSLIAVSVVSPLRAAFELIVKLSLFVWCAAYLRFIYNFSKSFKRETMPRQEEQNG